MPTARRNDNGPHTPAIRHWNWRRNSTSIDTWHAGDASRSRTRFVWRSVRSRSGSRIAAWSGRRSTRWPRWTSCRTTWAPTATLTTSSISIRHSSRIWAHRTRGTFRVLVRDSISCIRNHIRRRQRPVWPAAISHRAHRMPARRHRCWAAVAAAAAAVLEQPAISPPAMGPNLCSVPLRRWPMWPAMPMPNALSIRKSSDLRLLPGSSSRSRSRSSPLPINILSRSQSWSWS